MKNLFALLCTAALLAGCGGGASTSPDPQQTDTPAPDSPTSTPTPDPTPSDTAPNISDSGDGNEDGSTSGSSDGSSETAGGNTGSTGGGNSGGSNGGNTAGTSGGSGGSTGGSSGGSVPTLTALDSFTALANGIQNYQDYLDFDDALYEYIIENDGVLSADDIEYLGERAELQISSIYPDASKFKFIDLGEDVSNFFDGFETFFNLPADTNFNGIRRTFSSDIKLDFANGNTTLNPNGSSVTKVYATNTGEDGVAFQFHYTREGQNRIVTFTPDDRNEDGDYVIPAGTERTNDVDSPYDIESWGWWQQTRFRGSQERWPYVSVLGLWVGDATTSAQRNYVITGPATLPEDMPTAGSARFRGDFYALAHRKNAAQYNNPHRQRIAGDVDITFRLDDGTASGSIINISGRAPGLPYTSVSNFDQWSNSSFTITNGTINGNTFQATLTGVDTSNSPDVASVRGFTGDIDGGFFGSPETFETMIGAGVTASRDLDGTDNDLNLHGYIVGQE